MVQLGAHAISQTKSIARRPIVIARREPLNMQPADAAGRQNDGLGFHHHVPLIIEIFEDRAGTASFVVAE